MAAAPGGCEASATETYRYILHDHYFHLYPLEASWIVEHSGADSPASFQRWREVAYRGRTHTCLLAAAVVNDVLRPEDELARRQGDVLVVARCDLWRRKVGPPDLAPRRLPPDRLKLLGPLIKAGLRYELLSGDAIPEAAGFGVVLVIEETPQRNDGAFYRKLTQYVRGGGKVVVLGKPVYPGGRPDLFERLVGLPGVVWVRDLHSMVKALGEVLGRDRLPLSSEQPTAQALSLARALKELRRSRVYGSRPKARRRGRLLFDAVAELGRCRQARVLWDGTRQRLTARDSGRAFVESGDGVHANVSGTATSLLVLPADLKLGPGSVVDVGLRNEAGGGFLADLAWVTDKRRVPVLHAYLGPGGRFARTLRLGDVVDTRGRLELTVKHALVDGLEGAEGIELVRLRVFAS